MNDAESSWRAALIADSDAALRRLCATVERHSGDLSAGPTAGNRPLGAPDVEGLAGPSALILDALAALRTAVVGAADLAADRTRDIVESLADDRSSRHHPDSGVLVTRGQDTLQRLGGGTASTEPDRT